MRVIALGTMSIISRLTTAKYDWIRSSVLVSLRCIACAWIGPTDDVRFHGFSLAQTRNWLDNGRRRVHGAHSLSLWRLVLVEETTKEATFILFQIRIEILAIVKGSSSEFTRLGINRFLGRLVGVHSLGNDCECLVTVQEIGVCGIDVTSLGSDHVGHELVGGCHECLEKGNDDEVESVLEFRVSFECGL